MLSRHKALLRGENIELNILFRNEEIIKIEKREMKKKLIYMQGVIKS